MTENAGSRENPEVAKKNAIDAALETWYKMPDLKAETFEITSHNEISNEEMDKALVEFIERAPETVRRWTREVKDNVRIPAQVSKRASDRIASWKAKRRR
jgi:hypothetical protein